MGEDDLDLEEIKNQIRLSQQKEKELKTKYNQILDTIKAPKENSYLGLEKAIEEYMIHNTKEFTFEQKKHIINLAVKEITIIDSENVHIQLF
jgi:predicted transcriptional regulator